MPSHLAAAALYSEVWAQYMEDKKHLDHKIWGIA
jgi:hypothetical protein